MDGLFGAKVDCKSPEGTTREQPHSVRTVPLLVVFCSSAGVLNSPGMNPACAAPRPTFIDVNTK